MGRVKSLKAESGVGKQKLKTNFKKKVVRVRDRHADFSEQKLSCPICGTGNKTYRVLVQHCKEVHPGLQLVYLLPQGLWLALWVFFDVFSTSHEV